MIFFFKEKIKLQLETLQLYLFILPLKKLGNHLAMDWQKSNNFEKSKKKSIIRQSEQSWYNHSS